MFATDNDDTSTTRGRASTTAAWNRQKDAAHNPDTLVQLSRTVPPRTTEEHYRTLFFQPVDVTVTRLAERFDPASSGPSMYLKLESVLLQGDVASHEELMRGYPELDIVYSAGDVPQTYDASGAVDVMRAMSRDARRLFPQVERLIRLPLISVLELPKNNWGGWCWVRYRWS